jgi:hypothetical protein
MQKMEWKVLPLIPGEKEQIYESSEDDIEDVALKYSENGVEDITIE